MEEYFKNPEAYPNVICYTRLAVAAALVFIIVFLSYVEIQRHRQRNAPGMKKLKEDAFRSPHDDKPKKH